MTFQCSFRPKVASGFYKHSFADGVAEQDRQLPADASAPDSEYRIRGRKTWP